jgi:hypothetical protein
MVGIDIDIKITGKTRLKPQGKDTGNIGYLSTAPGFHFGQPASAHKIQLSQIQKNAAQLHGSRAPGIFFSSLAYFKFASA